MRTAVPTDALLIVDMINALDFPEGRAILTPALAVARRIATLKAIFKQKGRPVIYANDHYGQWQSEFRQIVEQCGAPGSLGAEIVDRVRPDGDDLFTLKPRHSAFYDTPLPTLLEQRGIRSLTIGGLTAEGCVLATALDAHVRGYTIRVPSNCTASSTAARKAAALTVLRALKLDTRAI